MVSDRSPEPPIKLVFLRSEFARSNGGFGFNSIRPTTTTSRGRDHTSRGRDHQKLAASMHDTRDRCTPLHAPRAPHPPSASIGRLCTGLHWHQRFAVASLSRQSRKPKSRSGALLLANRLDRKSEPAVRHRRARSPQPPPRSAWWASPRRKVRRTTPVNRPFGPFVDTRLALCRLSR